MKDLSYKDIASVEDLFTNYETFRIQRMLGYREARELSKEVLNQSFRYEKDAIEALKAYYMDSTAEEPDPPFCDCPPANGLRWQDMPITWAYNPYRQDLSSSSAIIRGIFREISEVCGARFTETAQADAGIVISHDILDGRGGTLGQAYQPASGDRMSSCGEMCGNITIDQDEIWTAESFRTIMTHEILHALGLKHTSNSASIMFPAYLGPRKMHSLDIAELLRRYPMEPVT